MGKRKTGTGSPRMTVRMSQDMLDGLAAAADDEGFTDRAELVRELIRRHLAERKAALG